MHFLSNEGAGRAGRQDHDLYTAWLESAETEPVTQKQ